MKELDTYLRFVESFATAKAKGADDNTHPVFHHDENTKRAIHSVLKDTHKHVFNNSTKSLEDAKTKHAAVVALSEPDESEKKEEK